MPKREVDRNGWAYKFGYNVLGPVLLGVVLVGFAVVVAVAVVRLAS